MININLNNVCDACDTCDSTCDTCVTERKRWYIWVCSFVTDEYQKNSHTRTRACVQGILFLSVTSVTSVTAIVSTLILKSFFCDSTCDSTANNKNMRHKGVFA